LVDQTNQGAVAMITLANEEAQQVLDALQCATPPTFSAKIVEDWQNAVEFLRARLAQPEPEPVADKYLMEIECTKCGAKQDGILTVNAPPQRKWQGLTDEEIMSLLPGAVRLPPGWSETVRAIEAKLKEKNAA
jgi:hypothetical protein